MKQNRLMYRAGRQYISNEHTHRDGWQWSVNFECNGVATEF